MADGSQKLLIHLVCGARPNFMKMMGMADGGK